MSRITLTFLLAAATLLAQPSNLALLLDLTEAQQQQWNQLQLTWQRHQSEKAERLAIVHAEIRLERHQPSPSPAQLGLRYYEIAAICQEGQSRFQQYQQSLRASLLPAQRQRFNDLAATATSFDAYSEAIRIYLIDSGRWQVRESSSGPDIVGCVTVASGPTGLSQRPFTQLNTYLELTPQQITTRNQIARRFAIEADSMFAEINDLHLDLSVFPPKPNPIPAELGAKVARLEQLCRQQKLLRDAERLAFEQILTPTQLVLWQNLKHAATLLPVLAEVSLSGLLGDSPITLQSGSQLSACNTAGPTGPIQ